MPASDPTMTDPPPPAPALGATFVRGMAWGTVGLVIGKFSSLLATVALGWIFGAREYAAVSAALAAAMIGDVLTDGGLRRVLVTRGAEYARIARTALGVAFAFNLLGAALMLGAAAALYHGDGARADAAGPLAVFAVALVCSTLGTVQRCKLSIDLRFARVAGLGAASAVLRNVLTVALAWPLLGLGPLAFALPLVAVHLFEAAHLRRAVGPVPREPGFDAGLARELARQGRWVILAMVGASLIYRGDFLVTSWLLSPDHAGEYFFAFQLVVALFSPLSVGVAAVVQPTMAKLQADPARRAAAFARMIRVGVLLAAPASLASALVAPLLVHLVWRGKWDAVATAVQVLAATECVRQVHHLALATIDARGEWRRSALLVLADGALVVAAAWIGCRCFGTPLGVAACVGVQRTLTAVAQATLTHRLNGGRPAAILGALLLPPLAIVAIGVAALAGTHALASGPDAHRWLLAAAGVPAVLAYVGAARLVMPARFGEAMGLVRRRRRDEG